MGVVVGRDKGRIVHEDSDVGISNRVGVGLFRKRRLNVSSSNHATFRARAKSREKFAWDGSDFLSGFVRSRDRASECDNFTSAHFYYYGNDCRSRIAFLRLLLVGRLFKGLYSMTAVVFCFFAESSSAFNGLLCLLRFGTTDGFCI